MVLEAIESSPSRRKKTLNSLVSEFGLSEVRNAVGARLSGGERRRCEIALAIAGEPSFVLLDEPFAGVDPIAVSDVRRLVGSLADRGVGVLITDHNARETLGLVDRAYIIQSGYVLAHGPPADIVNDPSVQRIYLGAGFRL